MPWNKSSHKIPFRICINCKLGSTFVNLHAYQHLPAISTSQKHQPSEKNSMAPSSLTTSGDCGSEAQYPPAAAQSVTPNDAIAYAPYRGTTTRRRFINSHRANAVLENEYNVFLFPYTQVHRYTSITIKRTKQAKHK